MYKRKVLPNGLRVLTIPMTQVKSVTVLVMVETGSRYEDSSNNGISHFLEHLLFKGTKSRPSALAISSLLDGIGAAFNAFTSKEYTGFYIKCASEHVDLALDMLSDIILNSLFDPAEIEKERGVVIEEMNMKEDEPQSKVWELYEGLMYPNSSLGMTVLGERKVIEKVSREEIAQYISKMYHGKSMVLGLAGSWPARVEQAISKYFSGVAAGKKNRFSAIDDHQERPKVVVKFKETEQAHVVLGVRAYPIDHPDMYALGLLSTILGGNTSSRLWLEVREKRGLAYYVGSETDYFHDCGYLAMSAGFRLSSLEEGLKVILEQLNFMSAKGVSSSELARAKDFGHGRRALALENSYNVASFYASQALLEKRIKTPEEVASKIDAVTAEDIKRVAKDIIKAKKLNLAVVGPFKDEERFSKILKL